MFAQNIKPVATSRHTNKKIFVFKDLATSDHVFLREDALRTSLQPAYTGPHPVIHRGDKVFKILLKGKEVTVSIDRLKPAYVLCTKEDLNKQSAIIPEERVTRSGRRVHFPDFYRP